MRAILFEFKCNYNNNLGVKSDTTMMNIDGEQKKFKTNEYLTIVQIVKLVAPRFFCDMNKKYRPRSDAA